MKNDLTRSLVMRWARRGLMLLVAVALVYTLWKAWEQLADQPIVWKELSWSYLFIAVALNVVMLAVIGLFWHRIVLALGGHVKILPAIRAFVWSQLGKYIPGKAFVVVIRSGMIRSENTSLNVGIVSTFVETMLWVFVGSQISCLYFLISGQGGAWLRVISLGMLFAAGVVTLPGNIKRLTDFIGRRLLPDSNSSQETRLNWRVYLTGIAMSGVGWLVGGASATAVVAAFPGTEVQFNDYWLILAAISLATVVGFVSLIPVGLGVRELVIIPLLAPRFSLPVAVAVAVVIRLVAVMAELVLSVTMEALHRLIEKGKVKS
jgi:glycosyltransferase 2 family protein